ncbi:ABC transporter permease [Streptacidiphilus sp. PB12-B1b]|nr:ABC transporter permease [Streptacidiphilus sp. PB12-B1b]
MGLVACYRTTGVLNVAQGAIAMIVAYALRQTVVVWHWPRALAAPCCLLLLAPGLGVLLDVLVFRPLQRRRAGAGETLVAGLGVFVLLIGVAYLVWGPTPRADAPALLPRLRIADMGGLDLQLDTVVELGTVLVLALLVGAVTRRTRFGTSLRAVVDDRRLAELGGLDADMVSSVGWAFGSFTAGLSGVLLAPNLQLDPYGLPLLVMETMAVAVLAGLRSLPAAIASALALGVAQSELTQIHLTGLAQPLVESTGANLFVLALLSAALLPRLLPSITREEYESALTIRQSWPMKAGSGPRVALVTGLGLLLPLALRADDLRVALHMPALALILLSVVVVTGYAGQISLGQAGYAGLGALVTGVLAGGGVPGLPRLPGLVGLAAGVLLAALLALLVGRPTIHRRGLALALATFAVGTALSRLLFQQPFAATRLALDRTGLMAHDRVFYLLELLLLGAALLLVRSLHRGRTGRALGAVRDHEPAAAAAGVDVARVKLLAFTVGAALAALGGGLLGLGVQAFDPDSFDPVYGLIWFAAVVVAGADSALGAVLAAAVLTALDAASLPGASTAAIGILALLRGWIPGVYMTDHQSADERQQLRLSPLGRSLAARIGGAPPTASGPLPPGGGT